MSKDMKCQYCGAEKMDEVIPAHLRLEHRWRCETPFSVRYDGTIQATTFRSDLCREREARQKAEAEVKRWKELFVNFGVIHCANYGREHFGDGFMHPFHYDLLKEAGARMDDFKKVESKTK